MADITNKVSLQTQIDTYSHKYNLCCFPLRLTITEDSTKEKGYTKELKAPRGWHNTRPGLFPKVQPDHNALGLVCGREPSGLFVLDIDKGSDFDYLLKKHNETEPLTWRHNSGDGKFHLIFKYSEDLEDFFGRSKAIRDEPELNIDVRTNDNFIFISPTSVAGKTYEWDPWRNPQVMEAPLPVPEWIKKCLIKGGEKKSRKKRKIGENRAADERQSQPAGHPPATSFRAFASEHLQSMATSLNIALSGTIQMMKLNKRGEGEDDIRGGRDFNLPSQRFGDYSDDDDDENDDQNRHAETPPPADASEAAA